MPLPGARTWPAGLLRKATSKDSHGPGKKIRKWNLGDIHCGVLGSCFFFFLFRNVITWHTDLSAKDYSVASGLVSQTSREMRDRARASAGQVLSPPRAAGHKGTRGAHTPRNSSGRHSPRARVLVLRVRTSGRKVKPAAMAQRGEQTRAKDGRSPGAPGRRGSRAAAEQRQLLQFEVLKTDVSCKHLLDKNIT